MKTTLLRTTFLAAALMLSGIAAQAAALTDKDGKTLYTFDNDKDGVSACYDDCAVEWMPYLGKEGDEMKEGWTLVKRTDGTMQWAFQGKPLYYYKDDAKAGDMAGEGHGGVWHTVQQ